MPRSGSPVPPRDLVPLDENPGNGCGADLSACAEGALTQENDGACLPMREPADEEAPPRPDARVAARVEELLREQLEERGIHPSALSPQDISEGMRCLLAPDGSMTYVWKGQPLLYVTPEKKNGKDDPSVLWRMFTDDRN